MKKTTEMKKVKKTKTAVMGFFALLLLSVFSVAYAENTFIADGEKQFVKNEAYTNYLKQISGYLTSTEEYNANIQYLADKSCKRVEGDVVYQNSRQTKYIYFVTKQKEFGNFLFCYIDRKIAKVDTTTQVGREYYNILQANAKLEWATRLCQHKNAGTNMKVFAQCSDLAEHGLVDVSNIDAYIKGMKHKNHKHHEDTIVAEPPVEPPVECYDIDGNVIAC